MSNEAKTQADEARGRIRQGYADSVPRDERRRRSIAAGFKRSEDMDALADRCNADPAAFAALSPGMKMRLGNYLRRREAAEGDTT